MVNRIRDRRRHAADRDLGHTLGAERIDVRVVLLDEEGLQLPDVGMHRHEIFSEIGVGHPPEARIETRLLEQRHADAADHPADALAVRDLGIDHAADPIGADQALDSYGAEIGIDAHLGEHGAEAVHRKAASLVARRRLPGRFDAIQAVTLQNLGKALPG
jgi:hypothetical protein